MKRQKGRREKDKKVSAGQGSSGIIGNGLCVGELCPGTNSPGGPSGPAVKEAAVPVKEEVPALKGAAPLPTKPYGTVTVALTSLMDERFAPAKAMGDSFKQIGRPVVDGLTDSRGLSYIPGLAERWEIAPDGLSWTFYLRQGVKFHNGDPLTARDVKFSIDNMVASATMVTRLRTIGASV